MRLLAIVVMIVAVVAIGSSVSAKDVTPIASPAASPVSLDDVGAKIRAGVWEMTLQSAAFAPVVAADSGYGETARGKFLVVRLKVMNLSNSPTVFPVEDVIVMDTKGRMFEANYDATAALMIDENGMGPSSDNLQPSIEYDYVLVFDVALDAQVFTMSSSELIGLHMTIIPSPK